MNFSSVTDRLQDVGLDLKNTWSSSKLWVPLLLICALVVLVHGQVGLILSSIVQIVLGWLACRTVEDVTRIVCLMSLRKKAIELGATLAGGQPGVHAQGSPGAAPVASQEIVGSGTVSTPRHAAAAAALAQVGRTV